MTTSIMYHLLLVPLFFSSIYGLSFTATLKANDDWWTSAVIYQIYPRSFKDTNNDGIGDLQGIISKIPYFVELGVDAIWLSPIYQSPMVDGGYDISDYRTIASEYGTMEDFLELLTKCHESNIKVIMDFVPNHTSDQHVWFNQSVYGVAPYDDYYVWHDGVTVNGTRQPPNNWLSVWRDSAWEWSSIRQQYYFHQFSYQQPDLNYRNPLVHQEITDIMSFWLDLGVDGFRIDAVPHVYEDALLRDEPLSHSTTDSEDWNYLDHIYTKDQNETFELVYSWREYLDNYTQSAGGDTRIFMTECATTMDNIVRYYGNGTSLGAHFSFNFNLLGMNQESDAYDLYDAVYEWTNFVWQYTRNWLTGNHDNWRIASRVGPKHIDAYNMLITFLPGVTVTYMAEEIGQENGEVTCQQGQDPSAIKNCTTFDSVSRDFERTPFQWDSSINAGFNDGAATWLPVGSKYNTTNVALQRGVNGSHFEVYKKLVALKAEFRKFDLLAFGIESHGIFYTEGFNFDTEDHFKLYYNVDLDSYEVSDVDFAVLVKSEGVDYAEGQPLVLQLGDSVILKMAS